MIPEPTKQGFPLYYFIIHKQIDKMERFRLFTSLAGKATAEQPAMLSVFATKAAIWEAVH